MERAERRRCSGKSDVEPSEDGRARSRRWHRAVALRIINIGLADSAILTAAERRRDDDSNLSLSSSRAL